MPGFEMFTLLKYVCGTGRAVSVKNIDRVSRKPVTDSRINGTYRKGFKMQKTN
jgi:hypothetical protein